MNNYKIGYLAESHLLTGPHYDELKKFLKKLIFEEVEMENPEFDTWFESGICTWKICETEKEAIESFLIMVEELKQKFHDITFYYKRDIDEEYQEKFNIAKEKYPEILV